MKDDIYDIKINLEEERKQAKSEKELYNNLVKHLYNIFNKEIAPSRPDLLERGFIYFSFNDTRKEICNDLAGSQEEYNYYFMNYEKALKQVKSFFKEDINKIKNLQNQEQKKEKKKFTIFGMDPLLAILLIPIIIFFDILDHN